MRYSKEKQQKDSDLFNEYIRRKNNKTNLKAYARELLSQVDRQSESAILWIISNTRSKHKPKPHPTENGSSSSQQRTAKK